MPKIQRRDLPPVLLDHLLDRVRSREISTQKQDRRVSGEASLPTGTEGMFPSGFDAHFDVALVKAGESLPDSTGEKTRPRRPREADCQRHLQRQRQRCEAGVCIARWGERSDGKAGIVLVFSEKDHSKDKKPAFEALFGKFGSALVISLHEDGSIYGCEVVHTALKKQSFSAFGSVEATDFAYENGKVEGRLTTNGSDTFFDETWEIDLKFVAPLGEIPKELRPAKSEEPAEGNKPAKPEESSLSTESHDESASQPEAAKIKARDLALTKDATDVEYQSVTGAFSSRVNRTSRVSARSWPGTSKRKAGVAVAWIWSSRRRRS